MKSKFLKSKFVILNTTISKKKTYDFGIKLEDCPRMWQCLTNVQKINVFTSYNSDHASKKRQINCLLERVTGRFAIFGNVFIKILLLSCIFFRLISFDNVKEKSADHYLIFLLDQHKKGTMITFWPSLKIFATNMGFNFCRKINFGRLFFAICAWNVRNGLFQVC